MNDLISRQEVLDMIDRMYDNEKDLIRSVWERDSIKDRIKEIQTAYDVDKVVKQLEKDKFIDCETVLSDVHQGYNAGLSRAIEIVKQDRIPICIHTYSDSYLNNLKKS